jgi:TPR repeat protein
VSLAALLRAGAAGLLLLAAPARAADPVADCDRLAAHPEDPTRPAGLPGQYLNRIPVTEASEACEAALAAAPDEPRLIFQLSRVRERQGEMAEALRLLREAVARDHATAMVVLASYHEQGLAGLTPDDSEVGRLLGAAAARGHPSAQAAFAMALARGLAGFPRDPAEAMRLARAVADTGSAHGLTVLAAFLRHGIGTFPDPVRAAVLFRQAADLDHPGALASLGQFSELGLGGMPRDEGEAVRFYRQAAEHDDAFSLHRLGILTFAGRGGIARDEVAAEPLVRRAAELRFHPAQLTLAAFHENGRGGLEEDMEEALRWYERAAAAGNVPARQRLLQLGRTAPTPRSGP